MSGQSFIKFFPSDWRSDPAVQMCSYAARGLWIEMLCIMSEASGFLRVNDIAVTTAQLARLTGGHESEVKGLLAELEAVNVFSRDSEGVIYSRRIIKDAERLKINRANGKRGGNPKLLADDGSSPGPNSGSHRHSDKRPDKRSRNLDQRQANPPDKQHPDQSDNQNANSPDKGPVNPPDKGPVNRSDKGQLKAQSPESRVQSPDTRIQ